MTQALALSPLRAVLYLNDYMLHRVHVVGLGCEAAFSIRLETSPQPGMPSRAVHLQENHGFMLEQLDGLSAEIAAAYPDMTDRTHVPVGQETFDYAGQEGERSASDPGVAVSVRYLPDRERLEVVFSPAETKLIDLGVFEELAHADPADLSEVELSPAGLGVYFPRLNVGLYVPMLWRERYERPTLD